MELDTKEEFNKLWSTMDKKMDEIKSEIKEMAISIAELPEKIFEKGDDRYAGKTVERIVYALVAMMVIAVMGAVINSAVSKPNYEELNAVISSSIAEQLELHK